MVSLSNHEGGHTRWAVASWFDKLTMKANETARAQSGSQVFMKPTRRKYVNSRALAWCPGSGWIVPARKFGSQSSQ